MVAARTSGAELGSFLLPLLFQSYLGLSGNLLERVRLVHGQFGQNLAVEFDVESLQALHKSRIRETLGAARGIDPLDPQAAEDALAVLAIALSFLIDWRLGVVISSWLVA